MSKEVKDKLKRLIDTHKAIEYIRSPSADALEYIKELESTIAELKGTTVSYECTIDLLTDENKKILKCIKCLRNMNCEVCESYLGYKYVTQNFVQDDEKTKLYMRGE